MKMTTDVDRISHANTGVSQESTFQILSKSVCVKGGFYPKTYRCIRFGPLWGHFWAPQNYPIWLFFLLEHYHHSNIYHIKFRDPTFSGSGWATPKMPKNGRFWQFFLGLFIFRTGVELWE